MKKTLAILLLINLSMLSCSKITKSPDEKNDISDYGLNGKVKSVKSEVYNLIKEKDTFKIGDKENSSGLDRNITIRFKRDGKIDFKKEYYANGKVSNEVLYNYDKDNRLIKRKEIDYYGKGSVYDNEFLYNTKDSIIQWTMSNDDLNRVYKIKRDDKNRPIKIKVIENDTINYLYLIEYDEKGNIVSKKEFKSDNIPVKLIERSFNEQNLKEKEHIVKYQTWDTVKYENQFFYDSNQNLILKKKNFENDSNFTKIKNSYHKNGKLKKSVRKPIGGEYSVMTVREFNKKGELIEYSRIPSDENLKQVWEYKYDYDTKGNWIEKINFKNKEPLRMIKRSIQYYE